MKKVFLVVFLFVFCSVVLGFVIHLLNQSSYDLSGFSLECEPDNIFVSSASDSLIVSINGDIREYKPNGSYSILDINANINSAYPDKEKVWFVDTENSLYSFASGKSTLVLNDIKSFSIGTSGYIAVSSDCDIFFWDRNSENPLCVSNVANADKIALGNNYALILDTEGQLYECVFPDDKSYPFVFEKIDELELIEDIHSGYGSIAVSKSGEVHYWIDSFDSGHKIPYIDSPSAIEQKCNELLLTKFSLSPAFCVGCNENGEIYFWGEDYFRKSNDKSVRFVLSPEQMRSITGADNVYTGSHTIYIKDGTVFNVINAV